MKTTIDSAGRMVIPKEIRQLANLEPGTPLEVRWKDGCIEIEPEPIPVKLLKKGRLTVAVPQNAIGALQSQTVEQTRQLLRKERASSEE